MTKIETFLRKSPLYSALVLENYFNAQKRRLLINITKYLLYAIPIIVILSLVFGNFNPTNQNNLIDFLTRKLIGLAMLSFSLYLLMHMFEAYFASIYYFEYISKNSYSRDEGYTFTAGRILRKVDNDNILTGFLKSQSIGLKIMQRLGINKDESDILLMKQSEIKNPPVFNTASIPVVRLGDIVDFIYTNHSDFRSLLNNHGLSQKDLDATADLVTYNNRSKVYDRRFWSKEKLSKIPGVASDWSFGRTYLLSKFSRNILNDKEVNSDAISFSGRVRELEQIQSILARTTGANAMLVGKNGGNLESLSKN